MKRVIIESPYKGDVEKNVRYARVCVRDCLKRGESPFASHLFYTQKGILDDNIPEERLWGIHAGQVWGLCAQLVAVYVDNGISDGMRYSIEKYAKKGILIEYRKLRHQST